MAGQKVQFLAPHCTVYMDDGAVFEIQTNNWDMLNWERVARKNGWPTAQEASIEFATWVSWHGLIREAQLPADLTYEQFAPRAQSVIPRNVKQDPTRAARGAG